MAVAIPEEIEIWSEIEFSKMQSAVMGIMAAFALTIIVLLIERFTEFKNKEYNKNKGNNEIWQSVIVAFISVFYSSVVGNVLFGSVAGELKNLKHTFMMGLPPSFCFVLSVILLMYAIVLLIKASDVSGKDLKKLYSFSVHFLGGFILLSFSYNFATTVIAWNAVKNNVIGIKMFKDIQTISYVFVVLFILSLLTWILKWKYFSVSKWLQKITNKPNISSPPFKYFIYSCLLMVTLCGVVQTYFMLKQEALIKIQFFELFIYTYHFIYFFLTSWLILLIPPYKDNTVVQVSSS